MPAGDLITVDGEYELNGLLMGSGSVLIGVTGVEGWETEVVKGDVTEYDLAPGAVAGWQDAASKLVTVPLLIVEGTEADARDTLADVRAAWRGQGFTDSELHRQEAGVHEYLTGVPRGCVPVMTAVKQGVIPVLCTFLALDPDETVVSS